VGKQSKMIVLGVILLAFVALATKPLWWQGPVAGTSQTETGQVPTNQPGTTNSVDATTPKLTKLLDNSFAKGKPVAVVYTYDGDC
jgi:hypothetical protein